MTVLPVKLTICFNSIFLPPSESVALKKLKGFPLQRLVKNLSLEGEHRIDYNTCWRKIKNRFFMVFDNSYGKIESRVKSGR